MDFQPLRMGDCRSLLDSTLIQITHIRPENAHRIRTDLDQEDMVVDDYPIALANIIVPFLNDSPSRSSDSKQPPKPEVLRVSNKRFDSDTGSDTPLSKRRRTGNASQFADRLNETPRPSFPSKLISSPPSAMRTPWSLSHSEVQLGTWYTARTTTPCGSQWSPLKNSDVTPSRTYFAAPKDLSSIPVKLFTPPRSPISKSMLTLDHKACKAYSRHKVAGSRSGAPLIVFNPTSRSIEWSYEKPTLILRHDVYTRALTDVFMWCKRCVEVGCLQELFGWLVLFQDVSRVRELRKVCVIFGLAVMRRACDDLLIEWGAEGAFE